jgi:hypothetical protein
MNKPSLLSQVSVHQSSVPGYHDDGLPAILAHSPSIQIYRRRAVQVLAEHDLVPPEPEQLKLIVQSALAAQRLYFDACLHHPDQTELHQVFEMFLLACLTNSQETENLCPTLKFD